MITVQEHKKALEAKGIHLSDQQVEVLLNVKYKLAHIFLADWNKKVKLNSVEYMKVVVHKENGNCVCVEVESVTFVYAYA